MTSKFHTNRPSGTQTRKNRGVFVYMHELEVDMQKSTQGYFILMCAPSYNTIHLSRQAPTDT